MTTKNSESTIEAVAQAIHDAQQHPGAWDDYGCWTVNTDKVHAEYREIAKAAIQPFLAEVFDRLDAADDDQGLDPGFSAGIGAAWHVLREFCDHDYQPRVGGGSLCTRCRGWTPER